jgi:signal transduction histidine kinase
MTTATDRAHPHREGADLPEAGPANILLVDDRPENLLALEAVLAPLGQRLVRATSGEEALRQVLAEEFAVILLDVQMPGTSGIETARLIKQRERSRVTPIIFLTALDQDRRRATLGYESGAVDYLYKPLDPDVLRAKVAAFVELYRNREALAWLQRRRFADAAIRESEERYRLVQKATNDAIWDWDLTTNHLRWSETAHHTFRYAPGTIPDDFSWWHDNIHPEDRDQIVQGIRAAVAAEPDASGDGHGWAGEYRFRLGDGSYGTFFDRGYVARDASGRAVRMIGAMQDVTERTRAQCETEAARAEAERAREEAEVARLAADEARARAEDARQRADEANRIKSDFLATMTHELRTPINAIVGYTELLELGLAGPVTEMQRTQLGRVRASSMHLLELVNDVLDLAKVEAGQMTVAREAGTARDVVESALSLVRPLAHDRGVALSEECGGEGDAAYLGDEHRVRQILVNLLSNAVKFTERGGLVAVHCYPLDHAAPQARVARAGPWTVIKVEDTGIGIAPEQIERIFEPFVQAEGERQRTYTRTQGGTGLGLAISRRLARLMGGDLTVESRLGEGSAFTLWLPTAGAVRPGESGRGDGPPAGAAPPDRPGDAAPRVPSPEADAPLRVHGLGRIGELLRDRLEDVVASYLARLRDDPGVPRAKHMRRPELEDHSVSLVGDLAQSMIIVDEAGEHATELLRDGSAIQRTIAEYHGARRYAQGWDEAGVLRDHRILREEIERLVRADAPGSPRDAADAVGVLTSLLERIELTSIRAWRQAARTQGAEGA